MGKFHKIKKINKIRSKEETDETSVVCQIMTEEP